MKGLHWLEDTISFIERAIELRSEGAVR